MSRVEPEQIDPTGEETLFDALSRLVPQDLQRQYYRVLAHTKSLSPDDEMLRILEAMGILALVTRHTPADIALERERLTELFQLHRASPSAAQKSMQQYAGLIHERLAQLTVKVEAGLNPQEISKLLGESLRQHFTQSGITETAKALEQVAATLLNVRNYLANAFTEMLDPHDGIAARVDHANRRLNQVLESRAHQLDRLLNDVNSHVLRVWMPIVTVAALLIGFGLGMALR
ncbi:hypothetical protein SAMN05421819_3968 [Bryocella elongata]|uniref:Uncharacterized protein n=1 Tax=Bryocella elongata TaxID=863522 RepID=A0A1H6BRQ0_9BACT|nr:hypothetical protein [Bryocella elongata]SEG63353.1 hypothetical protein SAMN05421819_3968 [Bryocella elongata]